MELAPAALLPARSSSTVQCTSALGSAIASVVVLWEPVAERVVGPRTRAAEGVGTEGRRAFRVRQKARKRCARRQFRAPTPFAGVDAEF